MKTKKVTIVGAGAIGCETSKLLIKENVEIKIVDRDFIEKSNLNGQTLYATKDIGMPKAVAAKKTLERTKNNRKVAAAVADLDRKNVRLLNDADVVLDCTDNFETRFLINDFLKEKKIPWIYAGAIRNIASVYPILPSGPCFRCVFDKHHSTETCDTAGVSMEAVRKAAKAQTRQAMKILQEKKPEKSMIRINTTTNTNLKIKVKKNKNCRTCSGKYDYLEGRKGSRIVKLCGTGIYQIKGRQINLSEIAKKLKDNRTPVKTFEHCIHFGNVTLFKDGRALIKAKSAPQAKAIYSRTIG